MIDTNAYYYVKANKNRLTRQQYNTLRGQVLAGDGSGAIKGVKTILARQKELKTNAGSIDDGI